MSTRTPVALVLIERTGAGLTNVQYTRILNRASTHVIQSGEHLERADIEAFRVEPDKILSEQTEPEDEAA